MITLRKSHDRGTNQINWLHSLHTFSFGNYYDPEFMGFGSLRVINEDIVQPGYGFSKHPHENMEIITYVVEGSLEHKDSMGTGSIIRPGEIQRMSAGTGVEHSEFNHSTTELLHLLQIWIIPKKNGLQPSYEQKNIPQENNKFLLIGSHDGGDHAVTIHQHIKLFVAYLTKNHSINYTLKKEKHGWLQLIKGKITLNKHSLSAGDGAAIIKEDKIEITCEEDAELLLFDFN
jgi:redox-sensitive bicupin YhaK (pirin superfamily)